VNVDDVIRRVQRTFGDENESQIKILDLIDWVNAAQGDICRRTEVLQGTKLYDGVQGSNDYTLPTDFIRAARVEYKGSAIQQTTLDQLDLYASSDPVHSKGQENPWWYIWGGVLHLYPDPNVNQSGAVLLYYTRLAPEVQSSMDSLGIPLHLHEDVVNYCMMKARELNEDFDERNALQSVHTQRMAESAEIIFDPTTNAYVAVRPDPWDYGW
jgi:hypothetical protein